MLSSNYYSGPNNFSVPLWLIIPLLLISCRQPYPEGKIQFAAQAQFMGSTFQIHLEPRTIGGFWMITSHDKVELKEFPIKYPVYRLECGDVTGDGKPEALVGVIKETPYDSVMAKRLFIYQIKGRHWEPLWLGSRVSQPLQNFTLIQTQEELRVRTLEKEQNGLYLTAEYRYGNFGLDFVRYLERNLTEEEAQKYLLP